MTTPYIEPTEIMLDLETNSAATGIAKITSMAMVPFSLATGGRLLEIQPFHMRIAGVDMTADEACAEWRLENGVDEAERWIKLSGTESEVLVEAILYLNQFNRVRLWAKPAKFDFPILENAFTLWGLKLPIRYRDYMCLSGYMHGLLSPDYCESEKLANAIYDHHAEAKLAVESVGGNAHCALSDCYIQIGTLSEVLAAGAHGPIDRSIARREIAASYAQ